MDLTTDTTWMNIALEEAQKAYQKGEVPVGALIISKEGNILGKAHNLRESSFLPTAHAEILAINAACQNLQNWRLEGCTLFVSLEPCPMCAGALLQSRISRVVFGATDPKAGAVTSLYSLFDNPKLNHQIEWQDGLLAEESQKLLKLFFQTLRQQKASKIKT